MVGLSDEPVVGSTLAGPPHSGEMPMQRRPALSLLLLSLLLALTVSDARPSPQRTGRSIVPPSILDPIIDEYSGEAAFRHVQMLATNGW